MPRKNYFWLKPLSLLSMYTVQILKKWNEKKAVGEGQKKVRTDRQTNEHIIYQRPSVLCPWDESFRARTDGLTDTLFTSVLPSFVHEMKAYRGRTDGLTDTLFTSVLPSFVHEMKAGGKASTEHSNATWKYFFYTFFNRKNSFFVMVF